jgi:hypothetical protein
MESNSLKMIKIDQNMLKLWQIGYTNIILTSVHLLILLQEIKKTGMILEGYKIIIKQIKKIGTTKKYL